MNRIKQVFDFDRWHEILLTITHNKTRSLLTAFSVFWGMLILVLLVGAGNGLEKGILSQVEGFANNACFFWENTTDLPYKGFRKGRRWRMRNSDIPILRRNVPEAQYFSPILFGGSWDANDKNVVRGEKGDNFRIKGCYPVYNEIDKCKLLQGRFINQIDIDQNRKVCLIGKRVYEVLFNKGENPIGKTVKVNGIYFKVIGVAQKMSSATIGGVMDESVILPFTTMQQAFNYGDVINFLAVTTNPGVDAKLLEEKIAATLKHIHHIHPDDKDAVNSLNIEEQFKMFNKLFLGISILIWIVGLGTLFAGAVGVSSIMLVTVRERTREIGIRRALGATPANIIGQILTESVVLTTLAGLGGIVLGVGILGAVDIVMSQKDILFKNPQISFTVGISTLIVLIFIGMLAGFIPAKRAMQIKAIDAIREE